MPVPQFDTTLTHLSVKRVVHFIHNQLPTPRFGILKLIAPCESPRMNRLLLIGEASDSLLRELAEQANSLGLRPHLVSEQCLYEHVEMCHHISDETVGIELTLSGEVCRGSDLAGVVFRPLRKWWPPSALDIQDQLFVYHETNATWFSLLRGLPCRVLGRGDLDSWLGDPTLEDRLRKSLELQLQSECLESTFRFPHQNPGPHSDPVDATQTVYVVGREVLCSGATDAAVPAALAKCIGPISSWLRRHDLGCISLTVSSQNIPAIYNVDPLPQFNSETPEIVGKVAMRLLEEFK